MKVFYGILLMFGGMGVLSGCVGVLQDQQEETAAKEIMSSEYSATVDIETEQDLHNQQFEAVLGATGMNTNDVINNKKEMIQREKNNVTDVPFDATLAQTCAGAKITTNKGIINVKLYNTDAPKTVANFCTLAQKGFYEGITFHRVIKDFMIQGGDPTGTGSGGPGYKFEDELPQDGEYKIGSLAMANSGPNTNGSQFFIVSGPDGAGLPPLYSLFGEVTTGLDVVEVIQNTQTGAMDKPVEDIVIEKVEVKIQ